MSQTAVYSLTKTCSKLTIKGPTWKELWYCCNVFLAEFDTAFVDFSLKQALFYTHTNIKIKKKIMLNWKT